MSVNFTVAECLNQLLNDSWVTPGWCPPTFDAVVCWPETPPNATAAVYCPTDSNDDIPSGIIYRKCRKGGEWELLGDYSECNGADDVFSDLVLTAGHVTFMYWIYVVGYFISLLLCTLSLLIFMHYKSLSCLRNVIHSNIVACFAIHNFIWLLYAFVSVHLDIQVFDDITLLCSLPMIVLKYFITATFFWMMVEGIYLASCIMLDVFSTNIRYWMCCAVGWGFPVVIMVVTIIVDYEDLNASCADWRHAQLNTTIVVPIFIVLLINISLLGVIVYVLVSKLKLTNGGEFERAIRGVRALIVLCPLLGINYGVSLFQPGRPYWLNLVFSYYTVIISSSQGAAFAIFFCLRNREVDQLIKRNFATGFLCFPPIKRWPLSSITDELGIPSLFRLSSGNRRATSTVMLNDNGRFMRVDFKKPKNKEPAVEIHKSKSSKQCTPLLPPPSLSKNARK
uniref:G_PROTEIN_RECEP_F2_4 domain-containing protein n=1 Tax=Panagrellus redivivus TaxID=6233 RepID=A0A7E4VFP5_PANRE